MKSDENFQELEFKLSQSIVFDIIEYQKQGINQFYFDFSKYNLDACFSNFFKQFRNIFYGICEKNPLIIFEFRNFSKELFDNFVLPYSFKNKFYYNFKFIKGDNFDKYIKKFGDSEFSSKLEFDYINYINKIEEFSNEEIKSIGLDTIEFLKSIDTKFRFVFVDSFGDKAEESSTERFVVYIYNNPEIFNQLISFCEKYFDDEFILRIKKYLVHSQQFVLSFALMKNGNLRKTLYFNVNQFKEDVLKNCFLDLNLKFDENMKKSVWGIGVDFACDEFKTKVYYEKLKVSKSSLEDFISDIKFGNKKQFLKILNCFKNDILNGVLFDYKYKDDEIISKRIDISVQSNVNELGEFFELDNKNLYTISFEFYFNNTEKINVYYGLK